MPPQAYVFSEADVKLLRAMADAFRGRQGATSGRPNPYVDLQEQPSPETCVFLTSPDGIGPLIMTDGVLYPGTALCRAYRLLPATRGLEVVAGLTQHVGNLSTEAVPGNKPVLATRDKWGDWWAVGDSYTLAPADEAGTGTGTGTGTGSTYPDEIATSCCNARLLPGKLYVTITSSTCACVPNGSYHLDWIPTGTLGGPLGNPDHGWQGVINPSCGGKVVRMELYCSPFTNLFSMVYFCDSDAFSSFNSQGSVTCSPFSLAGDANVAGGTTCGSGGQTFHYAFSE